MGNCPFLVLEQSHCAGCSGYFCTAFGRKKKLNDLTDCRKEALWSVCPRYTSNVDKLVPVKRPGIGVIGQPAQPVRLVAPRPALDVCPFLGPPPPGVCNCPLWCHAGSHVVRSSKVCHSRPSRVECRDYQSGMKRGVKPYASA